MAAAFREYRNHYSSNPLLDDSVTLMAYVEWAGMALDRRSPTFIVEEDGVSRGLATVTAEDPDEWEIELAGVEPEAQGRGLYRELLAAVGTAARASGARRIVISTQAQNIRVQRIWARQGWVPIDSFDTVHLVNGLLDQPLSLSNR